MLSGSTPGSTSKPYTLHACHTLAQVMFLCQCNAGFATLCLLWNSCLCLEKGDDACLVSVKLVTGNGIMDQRLPLRQWACERSSCHRHCGIYHSLAVQQIVEHRSYTIGDPPIEVITPAGVLLPSFCFHFVHEQFVTR